jgi:glycosyltransferase involved in cell wall biosynthesis
MAAAYKLADIVVVASREAEAFGRAAAEAQAMGCPVIATDIGAPPEFLNLGKGETRAQVQATAWLVPVADGAAIASRILTIMDFQPTELQVMADISRHYVKENFTTLNMQNQTIQVYETLLGGPLATVRA